MSEKVKKKRKLKFEHFEIPIHVISYFLEQRDNSVCVVGGYTNVLFITG